MEYGAFLVSYYPLFELNTDIYFYSCRNQSIDLHIKSTEYFLFYEEQISVLSPDTRKFKLEKMFHSGSF